MKKRVIKEVLGIVIFCLIFLPSVALAEYATQGPAEESREELSASDIAKELDLTPEQKEQLKEQMFQARLKKMQTRNKVKVEELKLRHELEKKEVDKETVGKIVEELKRLSGITLEQRVNSILEMKEIITPEQFEKLQSLNKQKKRKGLKKIRNKFLQQQQKVQ